MGTLRRIAAASALAAAALLGTARGEEAAPREPGRYGVAVLAGQSYAPTGKVHFSLLSAFALLDYGRVWHCRAPACLRFKVEASAGIASVPEARFLASTGMLAQRYLESLSGPTVKPYVEAGIGLIYTDFCIEGQGMRFNFNPQLGVGAEVALGAQTTTFVALRAHHVSNGHLHPENTGINSLALMVGTLF